MSRCDRHVACLAVLPGMGQAANRVSNTQPRPTCTRKGWTAETRMFNGFVQPPNIFPYLLTLTCSACARACVRARHHENYNHHGKVGMLGRANSGAAFSRPTSQSTCQRMDRGTS